MVERHIRAIDRVVARNKTGVVSSGTQANVRSLVVCVNQAWNLLRCIGVLGLNFRCIGVLGLNFIRSWVSINFCCSSLNTSEGAGIETIECACKPLKAV